MAWCYQNGKGVEKNIKEAVRWYENAADAGYAASQCNLGLCYERGEGVEKDIDKALELYRQAAEQGEWDAVCNLAHSYINGIGVEKDPDKGIELYLEAAGAGFGRALSNLGWHFQNGHSVEQNEERALEYFQAAVDVEFFAAIPFLAECYRFGKGTAPDYNRSIELLYVGAEKGDARSQCELGKILLDEGGEVLEDAIAYLKMSAQQDYPEAVYQLAFCYYDGNGTVRNWPEAERLCRKLLTMDINKSLLSGAQLLLEKMK